MLNVSEQIKTLYHNDNTPAEIILDIGGTEYNARNILGGSVTIAESINSTDALDFSVVEKGAITFTLFNLDQSISTLQGATVTAIHRITTGENTTEDVPLGVYTIVEALNDGDYLFKCTAYDNLNKFDIIIDDWWNELVFPQTIKQLLTGLCTYCGVQNSFPATFRNSDYSIASRPTRVEGTKGTEILGYLQEVIAMYVKCDREGIAKFVELQTTDTSNITEWTYSTIVGDYEIADFTVDKIDKVQVRVNENDVGIVVGDGENAYVIQANPLFYTASTETGTPVVQAIYDAVKDITYTPFKAKVKAFPYVEVGDLVKITTYKGITAIAPLLTRNLNSSKLVFDNMDCPGSEEREQVPTINRQLKIVNQRMHEVVNTVEEFSSTITEIEEEVNTYSTRIEQNSQNITLQAQRTGYKNWLYNSNFTDLNNYLNYWVLEDSSGHPEYLTSEVIQDEDFVLSNGKAVQFTKPQEAAQASNYARYSQTVDLNGINLNGKTVYCLFSFKINERSAEINYFINYVRYLKQGSTTWENINYSYISAPPINEVTHFRCSKAFTEDTYVDKIKVYLPYFWQTEYGKYEVNNMCLLILDSNDPIPTLGTWSDLANNDIVSQINLSPEGLAIQAKKVDFEFGETSKVQMRENNSKTGVIFDGTGTVDFDTNGRFYVKNNKENSNTANVLNIRNDSTASRIELYNYDLYQTSIANYLYLYSGENANTFYCNNKDRNNNVSNYIQMTCSTLNNINSSYLVNNTTSGTMANRFELDSGSTYNQFILTNNSYHNTNNIANVISVSSRNTMNYFGITNFESGSTLRNANSITLNAPHTSHPNLTKNSLTLTNYQRGSNNVPNSQLIMDDNMSFRCQNWMDFRFSGTNQSQRQFRIGTSDSGDAENPIGAFYVNGKDILAKLMAL